MSDSEYRVEMYDIHKSFGGVKALDGAQFCLRPGEIHALIGENGAGKSTLIRCLSGVLQADSGRILIEGEECVFNRPDESIDKGISVIYQEFALVQHLTVMENILLDDFRNGFSVNWKKMEEKAQSYLDELGFGELIHPRDKVKNLPVAHQQVVEICKALIRNARVLVLDEPTAVMTNNEVEQLFRILQDLKKKGVAIIYISHHLNEIFEICDRITVMRDGTFVDTVNTEDITEKELTAMMVGRNLDTYYPEREHKIGEEVLHVTHVKAGIQVKDVSFNVRAGEITCLYGLVGAGRTEAVRAILGLDPMESGTVIYDGKEINLKNIGEAYKTGIGYLSEDRKNYGVLLRRPIYQNITISALNKLTRFGFVKQKEENTLVNRLIEDLTIKVGSVKDNVNSLSGGNQQKVALAKILATDSKLLILDEPTRGVDVGAKSEIFKIINDLVEQGFAVLMISSEMAEVLGMADRIFVVHDGVTTGELTEEDINEKNVINLAMGVK